VVVDCGPTAETLRLLTLPEAVAGYVDRLFVPSLRARASALGQLAAHLGDLRRLLVDPATTSVRLVLTPERLVVAETRRTLSALALRGIRVDSLVVNRLVPRARWGPAAGWLRTRRAEQDAVLSELDASTPLPVHLVEHRAAEPVGVAPLLALARDLYGDADPLAAPFGGDPGTVKPLLDLRPLDDGGYELMIAVPLTDTSALDLARVGDDDLAVTVDGVRRLVALPVLLRGHAVTDAYVDDDGLVLRFEEEAGES
jgi:arsenite-transporting ATPase